MRNVEGRHADYGSRLLGNEELGKGDLVLRQACRCIQGNRFHVAKISPSPVPLFLIHNSVWWLLLLCRWSAICCLCDNLWRPQVWVLLQCGQEERDEGGESQYEQYRCFLNRKRNATCSSLSQFVPYENMKGSK